ncbi:MAG: hypothetical protein ACREMB_14910, partial [Candidatus Rokuibacteriota bacterium]
RLDEARAAALRGDLLRPGRVRAIDPPSIEHVRLEHALGLKPSGRATPAEKLIHRLLEGFSFTSRQ